jgi:hypothetical protein
MLPRTDEARLLASPDTVDLQYIFAISQEPVAIPRFRVTTERYLALQVHTANPVEFNRPAPEQVIGSMFTSAKYSRVEPSSAARYHASFVQHAGSLESAAYYLAVQPYRGLLEVLANNTALKLPGWIVQNPSKRRVLNHLQLRSVTGHQTPPATQDYFNTVSDELPPEAVELLEKGILERGFLLPCAFCSFKSWYAADSVGQDFRCTRCSKVQIYKTNPLWLYKLREVVFQGFEDNMQVPLLALNFLRRSSVHHFEWVPDSDIYEGGSREDLHRNVDLLCICDGMLYVGEAKSNDAIDENQFAFYRNICERVEVDGIVFATAQEEWASSTLARIADLRDRFTGNVLTLTSAELYPDVVVSA